MAYLVVADVADHAVRKPWSFITREDALQHLYALASLSLRDGYHADISDWTGDPSMIVRERPGGPPLEIYRIVSTNDEEVLRMSHAAPPTSYSPPQLP